MGWLSYRVRVDRPMPRSSAISRRVQRLVNDSRTASCRNFGVSLFPFPIEHLLVPQLVLSIFPGPSPTLMDNADERMPDHSVIMGASLLMNRGIVGWSSANRNEHTPRSP